MFEGKIAVVTGSSRGIGLAIARSLAERGARVIISSRKANACERVRDELRGRGLDAIAIPAHVGQAEDCRRLIAETEARLGGIDILIANAAVNPVFDPLESLSEAAWEKIMATNLAAPWRLARAALPMMAARGGGAMVLLSSVNASFGVPRSAAYSISKAGVNQLTRQLAVEWGARGVRVNAVAPGTTRTDMIRTLAERAEWLDGVVARTPLCRLGEPEDVAEAVLFLASDAARHITGQTLVVDGGETIMRGLRD